MQRSYSTALQVSRYLPTPTYIEGMVSTWGVIGWSLGSFFGGSGPNRLVPYVCNENPNFFFVPQPPPRPTYRSKALVKASAMNPQPGPECIGFGVFGGRQVCKELLRQNVLRRSKVVQIISVYPLRTIIIRKLQECTLIVLRGSSPGFGVS